MRTATSQLISYLQTAKKLLMAELFTLTLIDGTILRYNDKDIDISYGGNTYSSKGLLLKRSKISLVVGTQVDQLEIEAYPKTVNIGGVSFLAAARNGALDGAQFRLERIFFSSWGGSPVGGITLFSGQVSEIELGRTCAKIKIASILELLNVPWPINIYMPSCIWTLYSQGCGVSKSIFTMSGQVLSNSTMTLRTNLTQATGYFNQGAITFTSGIFDGVTRTLKTHIFSGGYGYLDLIPVLSSYPGGNTFTIYPGCDKSLSTCINRFSNQINFRGFPFVPTPETGI